MDYDQHRYKGFIVKVINGGGAWRAVVYDPMKQGEKVWDHYAISGCGDKPEALKKCHEYIDKSIKDEMQKWQDTTMDVSDATKPKE